MLPFYTDDDYLLPPPYRLADMDVLGFWLKGKGANLQAFLDKRLNVGAAQRYVVLTEPLAQIAGPFAAFVTGLIDYPVLLTYHNIGRLSSSATLNGQPLQDRGFFSYKEMILWVPVFAVNPNVPLLTDFTDGSIPPVFLVTPIILADNALAVAGGREIFGLPKRLGQINMPTIPSQASLAASGRRLDQVLSGRAASTQTDVLTAYTRNTRASWRTILDVTFTPRPGGDGATTPANTWTALLNSIVNEATRLFGPLLANPLIAGIVQPILLGVVNAFLAGFVQSIKIAAHKELRRGIVDHRETSFSSLNQMQYNVNLSEGHIVTGLNIDVTPHNFANISLTQMLGLTSERVNYAFHARVSGDLSGSAEQRLNP